MFASLPHSLRYLSLGLVYPFILLDKGSPFGPSLSAFGLVPGLDHLVDLSGLFPYNSQSINLTIKHFFYKVLGVHINHRFVTYLSISIFGTKDLTNELLQDSSHDWSYREGLNEFRWDPACSVGFQIMFWCGFSRYS